MRVIKLDSSGQPTTYEKPEPKPEGKYYQPIYTDGKNLTVDCMRCDTRTTLMFTTEISERIRSQRVEVEDITLRYDRELDKVVSEVTIKTRYIPIMRRGHICPSCFKPSDRVHYRPLTPPNERAEVD